MIKYEIETFRAIRNYYYQCNKIKGYDSDSAKKAYEMIYKLAEEDIKYFYMVSYAKHSPIFCGPLMEKVHDYLLWNLDYKTVKQIVKEYK